MEQNKRERVARTLEEKYNIVSFYEKNPNMKQLDIAKTFDMKPQTISDSIKNK